MKTNNIFLKSIVYVALVLFAFSCEKPPEPEPVSLEPEMPPLTHTGANTFGCYIDGELFVANEGPSVWSIPPVSGSFNEENGLLNLQGTRYRTNEDDNIRINAYLDSGVGEYEYALFDGKILGYRNWNGSSCDYYYENNPNLGRLTISHFDPSKNILSGTFYMTLTNSDCGDKPDVKITEGRFDFRY